MMSSVVTMSIIVDIWAVSLAAHWPDLLFNHVRWERTSRRDDVWWWWYQRGGKGAGVDGLSRMQIIASYNHGSRCHPTTTTGPHSQRQRIQQWTNILCNRYELLKTEKILVVSIFMTIYVTTQWQIVITSQDGHTTNAEHWWQQQRPMCAVYNPPNDLWAWLPCHPYWRA